MTFEEYIALIDRLLEEGKTTGADQSDPMVGYGKLNRQRMKRFDKTIKLNGLMIEQVRAVDRKMIWLILTEGWCGDAAQNVPVIEKIAAENPNIETCYILRDENLELMEKYLTNDARSIPKLIALDAETLEALGSWGPRPQEAMLYSYEMRESGMESALIKENIQRWYLKNKEQAIQGEFENLLKEWSAVEIRAAA